MLLIKAKSIHNTKVLCGHSDRISLTLPQCGKRFYSYIFFFQYNNKMSIPICVVLFGVICMVTHEFTISRSESYSVLSPFLSKLRYAYHRNRQNLFYLLVYFKFESEIAVKS